MRARHEAEVRRQKEAEQVKVQEANENIRKDQEEHEKELLELKQREQAEKAKNDMIAAKKAYEEANELQRLQRQLAYETSKEQYEIWLHRRAMMERAARLRKLERLHTQSHEEQERLKTEMEAKLREAKRRQVEEARKAAEDAARKLAEE